MIPFLQTDTLSTQTTRIGEATICSEDRSGCCLAAAARSSLFRTLSFRLELSITATDRQAVLYRHRY